MPPISAAVASTCSRVRAATATRAPARGELERDPAADAAPAARDERDPPCELGVGGHPARDPTLTSVTAEDEKRLAAEAAAELVEDGMVVGLGTGSTVGVLPAGARRRGLRLRCVATSLQTRDARARARPGRRALRRARPARPGRGRRRPGRAGRLARQGRRGGAHAGEDRRGRRRALRRHRLLRQARRGDRPADPARAPRLRRAARRSPASAPPSFATCRRARTAG